MEAKHERVRASGRYHRLSYGINVVVVWWIAI